MASCNYTLLNDLYDAMDTDLKSIASKIDELDLDLKIDELDIDLDAITEQIEISNKLRLLELVGTNVMTEEDQLEAYNEIKHILFPDASDVISGGGEDASGFQEGPSFP